MIIIPYTIIPALSASVLNIISRMFIRSTIIFFCPATEYKGIDCHPVRLDCLSSIQPHYTVGIVLLSKTECLFDHGKYPLIPSLCDEETREENKRTVDDFKIILKVSKDICYICGSDKLSHNASVKNKAKIFYTFSPVSQ